jgi:hypothetical protein
MANSTAATSLLHFQAYFTYTPTHTALPVGAQLHDGQVESAGL